MKRTIRAFSLGLFVAGIMMVVTFLFSGDNAASKKNAEDLPLDEMIEVMKNEGYRVVTEEEYITLSLADGNEQESQAEKDNNEEESSEKESDESSDGKDKEDKNDEEEEKDSVKEYTLHIKDGMPSSDIGNLLEENDIIEDSSKFNKYLEDEGYHKGVQLGKFKVKSDMSFKELAKAITR